MHSRLRRLFRRELDPATFAALEEFSRRSDAERGRAVPDDSRLLVDAGAHRLYAYPTTTGQVWFVSDRGGSVVAALPNGCTWRIAYVREPGQAVRYTAFGLIANDVDAVELEFANGARRTAIVGRNGFVYAGEGDPNAITAFVLHADEGSRRVETLAR